MHKQILKEIADEAYEAQRRTTGKLADRLTDIWLAATAVRNYLQDPEGYVNDLEKTLRDNLEYLNSLAE